MKRHFFYLLALLFLFGACTAWSVALRNNREDGQNLEKSQKMLLNDLMIQASLYFEQENYLQAEKILRKLWNHQHNLEIGLMLATSCFNNKHLIFAEDCLLELSRRYPENAVIHNNLGVVLLWQFRYDAAGSALSKACELDPDTELWQKNRSIIQSISAYNFLRRNFHLSVRRPKEKSLRMGLELDLDLQEQPLAK
jgi:tetratricopeptide (TPR) repeat protein